MRLRYKNGKYFLKNGSNNKINKNLNDKSKNYVSVEKELRYQR